MTQRKPRSYFFLGSDGYDYTRFRTKNKPTSARFLELFESVPFFAELESMARTTENWQPSITAEGGDKYVPGLVALPTAFCMRNFVDFESGSVKHAGVSHIEGKPIVPTIRELPIVVAYEGDDVFGALSTGEQFVYDKKGNDINSTFFTWGENGTSKVCANGVTVYHFFNKYGRPQYAVELCYDTNDFAINESGQLTLNPSDPGPGHISADEIALPEFKMLVGDSVGNGSIFEIPAGMMIRMKADGSALETIDASLGDIDSAFNLKNETVDVANLVPYATGTMLVANGVGAPWATVGVGSEGSLMITQDTGLPGFMSMSGAVVINKDGVTSINGKQVAGKNLLDTILGSGLEFESYSATERRFIAKIRRSLEFSDGYIQLKNDNIDPGSLKYYGTDKDSNKGYYAIPGSQMTEGSGTDSIIQAGHSIATEKYAWGTAKGEAKWYGSKARSVDSGAKNQNIELDYKGSTSDDIQTEITLANETSQYFDTLPDSCVLNVEVKTTAVDEAGNVHTQINHQSFKNVATVLSEVGSGNTISEVEDAAMAGTDAVVSADDANNRLKVEVTGLAATNINWMVSLRVDMLKF